MCLSGVHTGMGVCLSGVHTGMGVSEWCSYRDGCVSRVVFI